MLSLFHIYLRRYWESCCALYNFTCVALQILYGRDLEGGEGAINFEPNTCRNKERKSMILSLDNKRSHSINTIKVVHGSLNMLRQKCDDIYSTDILVEHGGMAIHGV